MDFLHDALAFGRKVRTLSVEDAFTREMLAIEVDTSLPALRVVRVLEKLRIERGLPVRIVIDHGTEFTSKALDQWAYENKVTLHFITPGRPMENGYIESFHGKFREECLNEHWFLTLDDARETIERLADRLQPGAPTQRVGLPDTGRIRNRPHSSSRYRAGSGVPIRDGGALAQISRSRGGVLSAGQKFVEHCTPLPLNVSVVNELAYETETGSAE